MLSRSRHFVAPVYLLGCLLLGGSAQGIWQNLLLQLVGLAIIAWAALAKGGVEIASPARRLLLLAIAGLAVVVVQLIPLPGQLWADIGPRSQIADGFRVLGLPVASHPLSLVPAGTLDALLAIIPPLALFCAIVRLKAYQPKWLALALIAGTVLAIGLGALQVASSTAELSPWYLYDQTSPGRAVGFFANADHMATLLVVTIPVLVATAAAARGAGTQRRSAVIAVVAGVGIVMVVGLVLNRSLAGYGLTLAVLPASALILLPARLRLWVAGAAVVLMVGALAALESSSIGAAKLGEHASSSVQSRSEILATTTRAIGDFMPFGSGLGSFARVYPLYEKPEQVGSTFVIHAHNDFAELMLELGAAGVVLIALFLLWWAAAVWRVWRTAEAGPWPRAAAIASAAMMVHSIVDFPLRTAAIAGCFAVCLALLADSRVAPPKEERELRRRRHVEFK